MVQLETQAATALAVLREDPWGNELNPNLESRSFLLHEQWGTREIPPRGQGSGLGRCGLGNSGPSSPNKSWGSFPPREGGRA